jgi:hypothetical protein
LLAAAAFQTQAWTNKQAEIDVYCQQLRQQFKDVPPYYFSGPDPWAELPELPLDFEDAAVATVYMDGTRIQWVVLELQGGGGTGANGWYEKVDYYFDLEGKIVKRERHLEHVAANSAVDESKYYVKGKKLKARMTHHALANGPEDWSKLFDPEAPEYTSANELPFPAISVRRQRLAFGTAINDADKGKRVE